MIVICIFATLPNQHLFHAESQTTRNLFLVILFFFDLFQSVLWLWWNMAVDRIYKERCKGMQLVSRTVNYCDARSPAVQTVLTVLSTKLACHRPQGFPPGPSIEKCSWVMPMVCVHTCMSPSFDTLLLSVCLRDVYLSKVVSCVLCLEHPLFLTSTLPLS